MRFDGKASPYFRGTVLIVNDFWPLGPNVTGYPGGYPNGYLQRLATTPWWGTRRLHVCKGTVEDGDTVDLNPDTKPTFVASAEKLPIPDATYDTVAMDPPYSDEESAELYNCPPFPLIGALKEAIRVLKPGGHLCLLHRNVYVGGISVEGAEVVAIVAVHNAARGPKPLRALQVWKKDGSAAQRRLNE